MWYDTIDGVHQGNFGVKKFQAIGKSVREAKYGCANAAIAKLGKMMPGVHSVEGEFPEEWITWMDENLARGVDPNTIVSILASKGFHPYKNLGLMQRVISWQLFDKFLLDHPDFDITGTTALDVRFQLWIKKNLGKGKVCISYLFCFYLSRLYFFMFLYMIRRLFLMISLK